MYLADPGEPVLEEAFDAGNLTVLRHAVSAAAAEAGLSGRRLEDFVLAVNEVTTNAVEHAGGRGVLRLWRWTDGVRCEVTDHGTGLAEELLAGARPPAHAVRGRGLWLATQLCQVSVDAQPDGTTVRLTTPL